MVLGKWGSLPDDCLWNRTPATVCNVPSHGRTAAGRLQLLCSTYVSPWMASFQTLQLCTWKVVLGANEWKRRVCEYILSLVWSEISDMRLLVLLIRFKYWDAIQSCSLTVLYCTVLYCTVLTTIHFRVPSLESASNFVLIQGICANILLGKSGISFGYFRHGWCR